MNKHIESPFDLTNTKQVIEFEDVDPYNPQNTLKGYINRRQGKLYGCLYITHVNNVPCEQVIFSAPKQHYPFDKNNVFDFPEYDSIESYEKLDGTCIIAYVYLDSKGNEYSTYKTRLRPFLGQSKFGNFFALWNEILVKNPLISFICKSKSYNHVFELYGKRNKILIDYEEPLTYKCTFAIENSTGDILPPSSIVPINEIRYTELIHKQDSIDAEDYKRKQEELENELEINEEQQIMKGKEGLVMYFIKDGASKQRKCKPVSVLKYHWSGDSIRPESILTTVINAFENFDEPTYDEVVGLLEEEYTIDKIEKSRIRITKILERVLFERKFQSKLVEDYNKLGVDINKDKVTVMRWFGSNYPKSQSKVMFRLLMQYAEKKNE